MQESGGTVILLRIHQRGGATLSYALGRKFQKKYTFHFLTNEIVSHGSVRVIDPKHWIQDPRTKSTIQDTIDRFMTARSKITREHTTIYFTSGGRVDAHP